MHELRRGAIFQRSGKGGNQEFCCGLVKFRCLIEKYLQRS
jgi:hypothetical protein